MKSIKSKLVLLFLIIALLPSTLSIILSYYSYRNTLLTEISQAHQNSLLLASEGVCAMAESASTISDLCYYDEILMQVFMKEEPTEKDLLNAKQQLIATYSKFYQAFSQINITFYISVYATNGLEYCTLSNPELYDYEKITRMSWFSSNEYLKKDKFIVSNYNDYRKNTKENRYVISTIHLIRDKNGDCRGAIMINVPCESVRSVYSDLIGENNTIYLVDDMRRVISCSDPQLIGTSPLSTQTHRFIGSSDKYAIVTHEDGRRYLASKYWIREYNWYLIEEVPLDTVLQPLEIVRRNLLLLSLGLALVFTVIAVSFANSVASPLRDFCTTLDEAATKTLDIRSNIRRYREIDEISEKFNALILRVKDLIQSVQQQEKATHQAELEQLKLQINPHFIYNTLFSIKCTVELGKQQEAAEMLGILSNILRVTLRTESDLSPLSECLFYVVQYFKLQKIRYNQEIELDIRVPDQLRDCLFPMLILQPLVENSIQHGRRTDGLPLHIVIDGRSDGENLYISVQDDGCGIPENRLNAIRAALADDCTHHESIGISNVYNQIKLIFGDPYSMSIESAPDAGTVIRLVVPLLM